MMATRTFAALRKFQRGRPDLHTERKKVMKYDVEEFTATDGDRWWSVVAAGDIATGVMHGSKAEADAEASELAR